MKLENYIPDFALEAVYDLTIEDLDKHGIRAVLVDLDNTLIAWNNPDGTPEMRSWLHRMQRAGITIVVVSNNTEERVKRAVKTFGIAYVAWAMKPFNHGIKKAMKRYKLNSKETVMVGDQLMTDIRASHRAGIRSILVKPLVKHDSNKTKFNRWRERGVLRKIEEQQGPILFKKSL